jgi:hypothetical protein
LHKLSLFLILLLFCSDLLSAQQRLTVTGGPLVAFSNLSWSIAGNSVGTSPNVLSELKFKGLASVGAALGGELRFSRLIKFNFQLQKSWTTSGHGTDTDYAGDNRSLPTFQEYFDSNKGYQESWYTGIAFPLACHSNFSLEAGPAYVSSKQNLDITNVNFSGLNSTYNTRWNGIAFQSFAKARINNQLKITGCLSYELLRYHAEADWNIISIFQHPKSFEQRANGWSASGNIGINYLIRQKWAIVFENRYSLHRSYIGADRSFLQNGNEILTRFNGAKLNNNAIYLGIMFNL